MIEVPPQAGFFCSIGGVNSQNLWNHLNKSVKS